MFVIGKECSGCWLVILILASRVELLYSGSRAWSGIRWTGFFDSCPLRPLRAELWRPPRLLRCRRRCAGNFLENFSLLNLFFFLNLIPLLLTSSNYGKAILA